MDNFVGTKTLWGPESIDEGVVMRREGVLASTFSLLLQLPLPFERSFLFADGVFGTRREVGVQRDMIGLQLQKVSVLRNILWTAK